MTAEYDWDGLNIEYEHAYLNNPYKKAVVKNAITRLKPGSRVLDVGCGTGVPVAQMLADAGMDVVGTDVSN
jgi:2-polyprenyl-3-methyl-5-hydroxy-6-metoxy-1,4-benzoquinol methylase